MIEGTTKSGFQYTLNDNVMNNMELVDAMAELDDGGHPFALSKVCLLLLGKEQRKRLYDHIRDEDGIVPPKAMGEEVAEIIRGCGDAGKNSVPSPE